MTSKFNMESFLSAVVVEEQRQHELREQEEDDEGVEDRQDDEESVDSEEYHRSMTLAGFQRSRNARLEQLRRQQKQAAKERALAAIAPKLEILRNMPFVIPFATRVRIFRQFVHLDKVRRRGGHADPNLWRLWLENQVDSMDPHAADNRLARHSARVKRGQVFQDALKQFYQLGDGLKEPIQITFVDQFDTVEAGIDGGGVTKEFLMSVTKEAFTEQHSLFVANNKNAFYPNPCALDQRLEVLRTAGYTKDSPEWRSSVAELMREYEFLGRIIGKCMYEGILIDIAFAPFFLLKWATTGSDTAYRANINDLREMDDELYQGMIRLKNYPGDVSELGLDFTINDQVSYPNEPLRTATRNLIPNGENTLVTNENRPLYISYVARHRLAVQPYAQTRAFLRGLGDIIDPGWLSMFNQNELQRLVGGDSSTIDVDDLHANTQYSGVYQIGDDGQEHPTIRMFWEVMHGLEEDERRDVLKYVTSTPRAPLLGFSQLRPPFTIRDGGGDQERLPSASTCVNLLKLPRYKSAATLKAKLLYAVTSGAGFDLS
jgi:ubiquitin-protein ligase E3 C